MKEGLWTPKEKQCIRLLQAKPNNPNSLLQIHAFMLRNSLLHTNISLLTKFISACSEIVAGVIHARRVFDHLRHTQDSFLCNSMIRAHVQNHQFEDSFTLYRDLRREGSFAPDNYTFPFLVKSCASNLALREGQQLHDHFLKMGFCSDLFVSTATVDMYAKFGNMEYARKVFDEMPRRSPASWTAVIVGYARSGEMGIAMELFDLMPDKDTASFNAMIDVFAKLGNMDFARKLFDEMPERNVVSWTSLISGYCKNGDLDVARSLFDAMPEKNLFSWNSMISGYCQNNQPHLALELFREMQSGSLLEPDEVTIVSIIPAIADLGAMDLGSWIHGYVRRKRFNRASSICTALVDMYAKCGDIRKARQVFNEMPEREVASWNAMINGFAVNGCAKEALEVFSEMRKGRVKPNEVTMIGVLSACSHGGLVDEGKKWFKEMEGYGISLRVEHYGCMVDLLGRAGCLEEAEDLINRMSCEVNGIVLSSLLFACGCHGDVERAERVMRKAFEMEPWNVGNYVMVRNMYAGERRWGDMEEVKGMMRKNGAKKEVGCSVIEVDCRVWEFVAGDRVHPEWGAIHRVLRHLWVQMKGQSRVEEYQLDMICC
ncbi:pentatricopeptide repeat (PPR-like) superfamily protein [Tasmannia lanceolata]|uniref:pentatricopeptide repeat (PPR-like) superfamily protein n=1 Tax=Tasmannia lanceolata TaxID=3420 RepID=UPI0040632391